MAGTLVNGFQRFSVGGHQEVSNSVGSLNVDGNARVQVGNTYIYGDQDQTTTNQCLAALRGSVDPRDEKLRIELTKGGLLKGVYQWILAHDEFRRWRDDKDVGLLWIDGDAGKGKTMLLCGIVDELHKPQHPIPSGQGDQPVTVSFFFCQATDYRLNGASAVLRGLIYLLVLQQPSLVVRVRDRYAHAGRQAFEGEKAFFTMSGLLGEMLRSYSGERCYMIIDALDECQGQLSSLLKFINEVASSCRAVKWLVSSRNIPSIKRELRLDKYATRICLELNTQHVVEAVHAYIDHRILELAPSPGDEYLRNELRKQMRLKSGATFLWIAIVTQELEKVPVFDFLEVVEEQPVGIEQLYDSMLERVKNLPRPKYVEFCRLVICAVFAAYRPLHLLELATMSGLPATIYTRIKSVREIIDMCGSFLTVLDDRVYLIHQSVKDYLTTKESTFIFRHGVQGVHLSLFNRSLEILHEVLRRDIYALEHPGASIVNMARPQDDPLALVEYPCVYWISHLNDAMLDTDDLTFADDMEDGGVIYQFLEEHLLHWLEALSLLRAVSTGGQAVVLLESILRQRKIEPMLRCIKDIRRVFQLYGQMIQEQPLQVYASILVFSPTDSIIRQWFQAETPKWLVAPEMIDQSWSAQVGALEHGANITAFAPSPDGKITVSVCKQKIRIWDMASSHCFMTLEAPGEVLRLSFSPDSRLFATASVDGAICVWDTISWCITANFSGPTEAPVSLKFSTDSRRIAAAFENHKTHVWDVADGICVQVARPRIKDKTPISIGLLQDDLTKVTVFENGETHVWNEWGRSIRKMTIGHGRDLSDSNIAFSENGRFLLCWSPDWFCKVMGLEIWDLESGQCTKNIPMERIIDSAALSSDGKYAGIVRLGTFFEIWDLMAECCIMKFKTGYSPVEALAFSMDAQQIIAQLKSGTLAIFDIASEHSVKLMEDGDEDEEQDEEQADMMVLSHDGQRTASICRGITTIKGVDGPSFKVTTRKRFSSLVFSPSDQNIAITYTNGSIEVWDASKGDCLNRFEGADDWRGPVSLATNDKDIAFVTSRCTFKIESIAASSMLCGLEFMGHGPLAFNKAGDRIAAGFDEKQIKLWSLTGECLACLQHTGDVIAVAVSPNDQHIATVSESTAWTVNIWDISGEWLKTMHLWSDGVYPSVSMLGQPFYIYFEDKGSRLHMTYNTLDLGPCELIPLAKGVVSAEYSGYGLSNEMEWITYKGQNVLWVPPDSRPWKWSIAPLTVATVNALKRVIYFRFADEGLSTPF